MTLAGYANMMMMIMGGRPKLLHKHAISSFKLTDTWCVKNCIIIMIIIIIFSLLLYVVLRWVGN